MPPRIQAPFVKGLNFFYNKKSFKQNSYSTNLPGFKKKKGKSLKKQQEILFWWKFLPFGTLLEKVWHDQFNIFQSRTLVTNLWGFLKKKF